MTLPVLPGPPANPRDRVRARAGIDLLAGELERVRASALAWRNGLGALLAGVIGFSLVKGRSDIGQLTPAFAAAVGVFLLAALTTGATAAERLMRAAHGRPYAVPVGQALDVSAADPTLAGRRAEAHASQRALFLGTVLSFACVALLTTAVGLTWYGPAKDKPGIEVRLPAGTLECGEVIKADADTLTLRTRHGEVAVALRGITGLAPVDSCSTGRG